MVQGEHKGERGERLLPSGQVGDVLPALLRRPDRENNALAEGVERVDQLELGVSAQRDHLVHLLRWWQGTSKLHRLSTCGSRWGRAESIRARWLYLELERDHVEAGHELIEPAHGAGAISKRGQRIQPTDRSAGVQSHWSRQGRDIGVGRTGTQE